MKDVALWAPPRAPEGAPRTPQVITNPRRILALSSPTSRGPPSDPRGASPIAWGAPQAPQRFPRDPPGHPLARKHKKNQWFFNDFQSCQERLNTPTGPPRTLPATSQGPQGTLRDLPALPQGPLRDPQGSQGRPRDPPRYPTGTPGDLQWPPEDPPGPPQTPDGAPEAASLPHRSLLRASNHVLAGAKSTPEPEHFARTRSHRPPRAPNYVLAGAKPTP